MKLSQFLDTKKVSPSEFAEQTGVSAVSVRRYVAGQRVPRPSIMRRIGEATAGQVSRGDFYDRTQHQSGAAPSARTRILAHFGKALKSVVRLFRPA